VRWPGIKPREESRLASFIDFMPTFLAAAGAQTNRELPGRNLYPLLENRPDWPERAVFSEFNAEFPYLFQMWRKGDYKLMVTNRRPKPLAYEFYNVAEDPYEINDLIRDPSQQERIVEFKEELRLHYEELSQTLPPEKPKRPPRLRYNAAWPANPWQPVQPKGNL
jgi:arylsulfatase A-like enzyme